MADGELGKKAGRGFYDYGGSRPTRGETAWKCRRQVQTRLAAIP